MGCRCLGNIWRLLHLVVRYSVVPDDGSSGFVRGAVIVLGNGKPSSATSHLSVPCRSILWLALPKLLLAVAASVIVLWAYGTENP